MPQVTEAPVELYQRLARLVGMSKALEMNVIGDPILADEAFELGLANRLVEDHELLDTALQWARKLAGQAPVAVGEIKALSHDGTLDADQFPPLPATHCRICNYRDICPAGRGWLRAFNNSD